VLLQAFYSIRSERQLMERLEFDLLFRWLVGRGIEDPVWDASTFSKNRDRLLAGEVAARFLATVLARPEVKRLLSDDHFSVDGTLIQAWASMKSFRPKDDPAAPPPGGRNDSRDFHGERRRNETHASTTDPEARLFRKGPGKEARLSFMGHLLMENRSGLVVGTRLTPATGVAERTAATALTEAIPGRHRITVAADRAYDTAGFVAGLRALKATPHVAQNTAGRAARIDRRTVRHAGYLASQRARKRIEEAFAWGQNDRAAGQDPIPRHRTGRLGLHPRGHGVQPDPPAPAAAERAMTPRLSQPSAVAARSRTRRPLQHRQHAAGGPQARHRPLLHHPASASGAQAGAVRIDQVTDTPGRNSNTPWLEWRRIRSWTSLPGAA
jgi:Transposase domain (DUF772)/Transposase DDE domain